MIDSAIVPISALSGVLESTGKVALDPTVTRFGEFIHRLRDDLWCYIEYPYVDRIYRDAYYHYFASKLDAYDRDCYRVSFFDAEIKQAQFFSAEGHTALRSHFVGFSVVRALPSTKNPGRTALSPRALRANGFLCELTPISANVGGAKLTVDAFPFSSQDGECMTCAETSIWTVTEYYGNKYPECKLALPSDIHRAFQRSTRVLPSEGLSVLEIASALSNFGFGTYLYACGDASQTPAFRRNLMYYIESGIPVILGLRNEAQRIGHAVVAIGHEDVPAESLLSQVTNELLPASPNNMVDTADLRRNLVLIDDNYPPYQSAEFGKPCAYYTDPRFNDCTIDHFVVPLNKRIYLDARKAHKLLTEVLEHPLIGWRKLSSQPDSPVIKRILLTSSNSFKSTVLQSDMPPELKGILGAFHLPKFIWIAELSTPDIYFQTKATGLMLLDATGSDSLQSVKMLLYPGAILSFDGKIKTRCDLGAFSVFKNNLKGNWSKWQC